MNISYGDGGRRHFPYPARSYPLGSRHSLLIAVISSASTAGLQQTEGATVEQPIGKRPARPARRGRWIPSTIPSPVPSDRQRETPEWRQKSPAGRQSPGTPRARQRPTPSAVEQGRA